MASIYGQARRDMERAATHLARAFDRIKWLISEYADYPDFVEMLTLILDSFATTKQFLDETDQYLQSL